MVRVSVRVMVRVRVRVLGSAPKPQLNLVGSHTDTPLHPPFNHNKSTRLLKIVHT